MLLHVIYNMYWYFQCTEFTTENSQNGVKYLGQKNIVYTILFC